jgi:C4-dicarboxylate transporter DctM subunit
MGILQMIISYFIAKKRGYSLQSKASRREVWKAFKDGFAAMMMPVILIVGILSGYFTPTEGACVATVYSILIGMFVYKTLTFKKLFKILMDTSVFAGATLFVLSMAAIFGLVLTHNQIPTKLTAFFLGLSDNKYILLFLINILLLVLGMLMEGNAIYMIMGPILGMLAIELGCNPVHFGIMVIFNLTLGLITPPVGLCLFLTQKVAKITTSQMVKSIMPFVIMMIICLFIITYFPPLVTWLPGLFHLC